MVCPSKCIPLRAIGECSFCTTAHARMPLLLSEHAAKQTLYSEGATRRGLANGLSTGSERRLRKKYFLALAVQIVLVLGFVLGVERNVLAALAGIIIFWYSISHPPVGMALFVVTLPYSPISLPGIGASPFVIWTPAFILGTTTALAIYKVDIRGLVHDMGLLLLFVLLIGLSSTNRLPPAELARFTMSSACLAAVAILICIVAVRFTDGFPWLLGSFIAAGSTATAASLLVGVDGYMTLNIREDGASGVCFLMNPVSLAYVALFLCTAKRMGVSMPAVAVPKLGFGVGVALMAGAILVAMLGVSRATVLAMGILPVLSIFTAKKDRLRYLVRVLAVSGCLVACAAVLWTHMNAWTKGRLTHRTSVTISRAHGVDTRLEIWRAGLGEMSATEWVFGSGAGVFRDRAFGYYEHSVFVSILHAGGVVGAAIVLFLLLRWGRIAARRGRLHLYLLVGCFVVARFSTHGSLSTKTCWVFLGLLGAIAHAEDVRRRWPYLNAWRSARSTTRPLTYLDEP